MNDSDMYSLVRPMSHSLKWRRQGLWPILQPATSRRSKWFALISWTTLHFDWLKDKITHLLLSYITTFYTIDKVSSFQVDWRFFLSKNHLLFCVGRQPTLHKTTSTETSSLLSLDLWQQPAALRGSHSFHSVSSKLKADRRKEWDVAVFGDSLLPVSLRGAGRVTKTPQENLLCEHINSFFQTASKDSRDLEVTSPFPWANTTWRLSFSTPPPSLSPSLSASLSPW